MRSLVPALLVITLALLLAGGASLPNLSDFTFQGDDGRVEQAADRPNPAALGVRRIRTL